LGEDRYFLFIKRVFLCLVSLSRARHYDNEKKTTKRKTLLQMSFQQTNKRGLAYNCEWCGEDNPFIAERYRVDSHIWKRHLSLDCSLYYCILCMFKATSQPAIKRHCRTFKPHLNQGEEMVREGSFRGDDFYIHQSKNAYVITDMDRKPLSPTASRLHWMQVVSIKPILPVSTTNATPIPSETQGGSAIQKSNLTFSGISSQENTGIG
jgi:hypothetical protein